MSARLFAAMLAWVAAFTVSAATAQPHVVFGFDFPESIAQSTRGAITDLEARSPGAGSAIDYQRPGWVITVYIYDDRITAIPDDLDSQVLQRQFASTTGAVRQRYSGAQTIREFRVADARGRDRLLCASLAYSQPDGTAVDSFACVGPRRDKFIKFRLTTHRASNSETLAREYLEAWVRHAWPA